MTPKEVLEFAKKNNAVMFDLKFMDLPGMWQHCAYPISELNEKLFEEGRGFDGSSIRGWRAINASDMLLIPDPATAMMDPFTKYPALSLIANVVDPKTGESYSRDPRYICQKAAAHLKSTGIADTAYFGPEAEFFILDDVRYHSYEGGAFYEIDSVEAQWNTGREESPNLGYKPRFKEGYFPVPPSDSTFDLRSEMVLELEKAGIAVEAQHHEVATAGQGEIDMRFDEMTRMADKLMIFKYVVKNVARRAGRTVTFMPKPVWNDNGSGMHAHQSLWKDGKPLFAGSGYAGLSETALHYIGGILKRAKSLAAIVAPTTNSYKRLVPGFEAPVKLAYSSSNRSAAIRIPTYSDDPKAKRIEARFPDPSCNGYLAFAAMLMAGLDGIQNRIDPGSALDKNIYGLAPEELAEIESIPASLEDALKCLEEDHDYLLKGDVFTEDMIEKWIEYKMESEVGELRKRPHPYEFTMYYDI